MALQKAFTRYTSSDETEMTVVLETYPNPNQSLNHKTSEKITLDLTKALLLIPLTRTEKRV